MPVKKRLPKRKQVVVTPEAVRLFRQIEEILDADAHRESLAMVVAERDGTDIKSSRNLDRLIGGSIAHYDHLVDERMTGESRDDFRDRILFVVGSDDS